MLPAAAVTVLVADDGLAMHHPSSLDARQLLYPSEALPPVGKIARGVVLSPPTLVYAMVWATWLERRQGRAHSVGLG